MISLIIPVIAVVATILGVMFGKMVINGTATANITTVATTTTSFTVSLPNNATGIPRRLRVAGSVSGSVSLMISATKTLTTAVTPNAGFSYFDIPASAFQSPVSTVTGLSYYASAVGTFTVLIDYQ